MAIPTPPSPLQQALDLLRPAVGILDSFNHRNKNQHRLSKWWGPFDMLRRGARKLVVDLEACLEAQARAASTGGTKKKKKASTERESKDKVLRRKMETRARHVKEQLVPRAFLAFTQVAADNQYAHLGLALVGVLAQVNAAVEQLVPVKSEEDHGSLLPLAEKADAEPSKDVEGVADLGVAVSRSAIEGQSASVSVDRKVSAKPKNVKQSVDELDPGPSETVIEERSSKVKPKKSKKSRDEFDSLFDTLEPKKPAKKKRWKKGDEFDNLFSSLV